MLDKIRMTLLTAAMDIYSIRCDALTAFRRRSVTSYDESDPALFDASVSTILKHLNRNRRAGNDHSKRRRIIAPSPIRWNRDQGGRLRGVPRISYDETYCGFDLPSAYLLTRPMLKRLHGDRMAPIPWF